jgi:hypothetical protein
LDLGKRRRASELEHTKARKKATAKKTRCIERPSKKKRDV